MSWNIGMRKGRKYGGQHHRAKLSSLAVEAIRLDYEAGEGGYETLAKKHGCAPSTVRDIVKEKTRVLG